MNNYTTSLCSLIAHSLLLLLCFHHSLGVLSPSLEPPRTNQYRQATNNNASIVHVGDLHRLDVGEGEEHNREGQPANRHDVHNSANLVAHVKHAFVHVLPASKEVGEDWEHVRDVVDGDGRAQERVEGS